MSEIRNWNGQPLATATNSAVNIQVVGLSGGDSYSFQLSLNGLNYVAIQGTNLATLAIVSSITVDGIYSFAAAGLVKLVKTGTVSTPSVTLEKAIS